MPRCDILGLFHDQPSKLCTEVLFWGKYIGKGFPQQVLMPVVLLPLGSHLRSLSTSMRTKTGVANRSLRNFTQFVMSIGTMGESNVI